MIVISSILISVGLLKLNGELTMNLEKHYTFEQLLDAIAKVESGGMYDDAVGDNGDAIGSFQIHKVYVDDVNRIIGKNRYSYRDRHNFYRSKMMVGIYLTH